MKKLYLLPLLLLCLYGYAQTKEIPRQFLTSQGPRPLPAKASNIRTAAACPADTILYPYLKELSIASADSFFIDAMVGNVRTASQAYINEGSVSVKGVQFWGAAYSIGPDPKTLNVEVSVWSVNAQYMPVTQLAAATATITHEYDFYSALFSAPVSVNGNYAVLVRSIPNDTLAVITNNAGSEFSSVDYGEGLGWRRFGSGVWNTTESFFGQDMEYMIFPIVELSITADFNNNGTAEVNSPHTFTNTTTGHLASRFYNLNVFDQYWGLTPGDSSYTWNFGDGGTSRSKNAIHTYASPGVYNVTLTADLEGYFRTCQDVVMKSLTADPAVITDTLLYPYFKELELTTADSFFIDAMVGNVRTASQAYANAGTLSIKGVQFWGAAYSTQSGPQTLDVQVSVWSVDAQNMPVTEIATATSTITEEYKFYTALFAAPVNVSGNYAVLVRSIPNDTLAVITNNAGSEFSSINYGEGLAWRRFGSGAWNPAAAFFGQDMEYMIFPIVRHQEQAAFTTDGIGTNTQPEVFTNTSDPAFNNRMMNLNVFYKYWNLSPNDTTYLWNYGDGTTEVQVNGEHTYADRGNFTVSLTARLKGYFVNYSDVATGNMTITYALPATLGRFSGEKLGNVNRLQWTVVTEENMEGYSIERSADGRNFVAIGQVNALNRSQSKYQWTDAQPAPRSFYRLRMMNRDGTSTYSGIVLLSRNQQGFEVFTAGPRLILVSEAEERYTITVYSQGGSLLGRQAISAREGQQTITLPWIEHAANGVYVVEVQGRTNRKTLRIVK